MTASGIVIAMDEAGNSGGNLLDAAQPVFALAAVRAGADVDAAVARALTKTQMKELKFARLRTSAPGRRNVVDLLTELQLTPATAAATVTAKAWMVAAKLIDELVEPAMLARGLQHEFYASGSHRRMADDLFHFSQRAMGSTYDELIAAFQAMLRGFTDDRSDAYLSALRRCRLVCRDARLTEILAAMLDSRDELASEFGARRDTLDPGLPSLHWQVGYWSDALQAEFSVVHDESRTASRWIVDLNERAAVRANLLAAGETVLERMTIGDSEVVLPHRLIGVELGRSQASPALQLADVLAGASAHMFAVETGIRPVDKFARDLSRTGLVGVIPHAVGPVIATQTTRPRAHAHRT